MPEDHFDPALVYNVRRGLESGAGARRGCAGLHGPPSHSATNAGRFAGAGLWGGGPHFRGSTGTSVSCSASLPAAGSRSRGSPPTVPTSPRSNCGRWSPCWRCPSASHWSTSETYKPPPDRGAKAGEPLKVPGEESQDPAHRRGRVALILGGPQRYCSSSCPIPCCCWVRCSVASPAAAATCSPAAVASATRNNLFIGTRRVADRAVRARPSDGPIYGFSKRTPRIFLESAFRSFAPRELTGRNDISNPVAMNMPWYTGTTSLVYINDKKL